MAAPAIHRAGSKVSVYWPGADDWYDATVQGHVNYGDELLHVLEYEGGTLEQVKRPRRATSELAVADSLALAAYAGS